MLPLQGDRKPVPLLHGPATEMEGRVSPDGRWLVYSSTETGRSEIYVGPFPDLAGKWMISTEGGQDPMWHPNGNELFFRNGDQVLAVDVSRTPVFKAGVPRVLLRGNFLNTGIDSAYTANGDRFVFIQALLQNSTPEIRFVLNWFPELSRRVPPSR